jgi:hypothetical protein
MAGREAARFPPGWLVIAVLALSFVLWAILFFVTLPHLQALAGGRAPFDLRIFGYSYAEARTFLTAIGEPGRAYYLNPELVLDSFYPPLYAASRGLALWWLTAPGRVRDRAIPAVWRTLLVALPILVALIDGGVENVCIAKMIGSWPDLSAGVVQLSSAATQAKFLLGAPTEVLLVVFAILWALRRLRSRVTVPTNG